MREVFREALDEFARLLLEALHFDHSAIST